MAVLAFCYRLCWCLSILTHVKMVAGFVTKPASSHFSISKSSSRLHMVRNIDLPEALVFYGRNVILEEDEVRYGVPELLQECRDVETATILIDDMADSALPTELKDLVVFPPLEQKPPNPRCLWQAIHSISVQPRGFGGSSGFGRKQADQFIRPPLPQHVVVFCDSVEVCRAARYCGMRVVCLEDNDLADAIVDEFDGMYLDDFATPGSYWLNPPHARDDDGNRVDPEEIMEWYESKSTSDENDDEDSREQEQPPLPDDELNKILADLDPL